MFTNTKLTQALELVRRDHSFAFLGRLERSTTPVIIAADDSGTFYLYDVKGTTPSLSSSQTKGTYQVSAGKVRLNQSIRDIDGLRLTVDGQEGGFVVSKDNVVILGSGSPRQGKDLKSVIAGFISRSQ